ncbi:hypothetical protein HER10_EVM0008642 [Colletotrichum scovillei]|uniref:Uncharacterized protein n=1 Tax=Colletotrichum scovillei TaxID=1209932 RepID=A0A9P7U5I6_9PEZI|nr:uncharacterized protein HER10_EVM0008642 [Colletotrichum scovillei]KAF4785667.1 hypothetical protein HER10_EVM0008642 [Colletotrichum scovillei]KAG7038153.1 hypothetical protein JMJ78_0008230 [Colletotrichum scovillei]KAG7040495.1 hypothetical protein JMJ77_0003734 [Colletotrichum scovillei]
MSPDIEDRLGNLDLYPASYFMPIRHGGQRPVKVAGYTLRALAETCRSEERYNAARESLMSIIHIFHEEIEMLRIAESPATKPTEQGYLNGWEDALQTVIGVLNYCIVKPVSQSSPNALPEKPQQLDRPLQSLRVKKSAEMYACRPLLSLESLGQAPDGAKGKGPMTPDGVDIRQEESAARWLEFIVGDEYHLPNKHSSLDIPSTETNGSGVSTPSTTSSGSSAQNLLSFPSSQDTERSALAEENQLTPDALEFIRSIDTIQILLHYERQCRISERRIAAELIKSSVLRQAIFQDRIGRMPRSEGANGRRKGDVEDSINDPFFGQTMYEKAVGQVKSLFRRWGGTAWQDDTETEADTETDTDTDLKEASTQAVDGRAGSIGESLMGEYGYLEPSLACLNPESNLSFSMVRDPSYQLGYQGTEAFVPGVQAPIYQTLFMRSPDLTPKSGSSCDASNLLSSSEYRPLPSQSDLMVEANSPEDAWDLLSSSQDSLASIEQVPASREREQLKLRKSPFLDYGSHTPKKNFGGASYRAPLAASRTSKDGSQGTSAEPDCPVSSTGHPPPSEPWTVVCQCKGCQERASRDQV